MAPNETVARTTSRVSEMDEKVKLDVHNEEVAMAKLTEEDLYALSSEARPPKWRIFLIMVVMGCNQAGYGVDWAVISGINSFDYWHTYFGFETSGSTFGIITALMTIGNFCGAYFLSLQDVIGRRGVNFLGNALVIVAALMQGLSTNLKVFMAGRFILGFGSALMSSSQYMAEIAPVHLRGRLVGIFGACFQVGSVVFLGVMFSFADLENVSTIIDSHVIDQLTDVLQNWSWRIPLLLEALFPAIVCATIYLLCPESPRYYVQKSKYEKARHVIAKYMTNRPDDVNQPLVRVMVSQIEESIENDKADRFRQFWDYRVFFTKPVRFRLMVLILYSCFQSWNGGGIISTFLAPALETVGIDGTKQQLGINIGLTATYFVFTLFGSYIIDKFNRRTLIFAGLISVITMQTLSTITSWRYSVNPTPALSYVVVLWIFIFQILSSTFIATMHNLYPVEILSLVLRARGMGLYGMIQGAAGTVQGYGISVGINKLGYKIWVVYIAYNCLQLIAAYYLFPETFGEMSRPIITFAPVLTTTTGLSLEEIDAVFETNGVHPVKMSKDIQRVKREQGQGLHATGRSLFGIGGKRRAPVGVVEPVERREVGENK